MDNVLTNTTNLLGNTVFTLSGTTLTFTDAPTDGAIIYLQGSDTDHLLLDGTDTFINRCWSSDYHREWFRL